MPTDKKKLKEISYSRIYTKAYQLARENTLETLYEKTKLPISWLRKFRSGAIKNPSVNTIEKLITLMNENKTFEL